MEKEPRQLLERNFGLAEQRRNIWLAVPSNDATEEDVIQHEYWAHISRLINPCDRIDVIPDSTEWMLELIVLSVDKVGANVHVLHRHDFRDQAGSALDATDAFAVRWRGPYDRFGVVRKDSGEVIKAGFQTKEAALEFMRDTSLAA